MSSTAEQRALWDRQLAVGIHDATKTLNQAIANAHTAGLTVALATDEIRCATDVEPLLFVRVTVTRPVPSEPL